MRVFFPSWKCTVTKPWPVPPLLTPMVFGSLCLVAEMTRTDVPLRPTSWYSWLLL